LATLILTLNAKATLWVDIEKIEELNVKQKLVNIRIIVVLSLSIFRK
jgi:hypothetical protein